MSNGIGACSRCAVTHAVQDQLVRCRAVGASVPARLIALVPLRGWTAARIFRHARRAALFGSIHLGNE